VVDLAGEAQRLAANGAWYAIALPEALRFRRAIRDPAAVRRTQEGLLLRLLGRNAATEYGRRLGFEAIRSTAEFQARVPLTRYADYAAAVGRIGEGAPGVLTADRVTLLEPTSGSTAATKLIPYTPALKREFQRAIAPWIVDLFGREPRLLSGQAYWSVSPVARRTARTAGGLPIGFEDDADYLSGVQRRLVQRVMAVPSAVRHVEDLAAFRYVTLFFLLRSRSLALISVWSPTFLSLLVAPLRRWWSRLADDVAAGTLTAPGEVPADVRRRLLAGVRPDPARAAEIRHICRPAGAAGATGGSGRAAGGGEVWRPGGVHARLWPRLRLISCWADAQAAPYAASLSALFPQARLQPKGLIATEGFVSLPFGPADRALLALRSHFFEFIPLGPPGRDTQAGPDTQDPQDTRGPSEVPLLAHQLARDACYAVVITTGGGLYRYQLQDVVQVVGYHGGCPMVRFVGRRANVSDWFGEKLDERHVRTALEAVLGDCGLRPRFAMLACDVPSPGVYGQQAAAQGDSPGSRGCPGSPGPAYTLFVEAEAPAATLRYVRDALEVALRQNYHDDYCRDLGQLGPLRLFSVTQEALETYAAVCQARGQRAGDVKPTALDRGRGWSSAFQGRFLA
jgi:hypothetical protein